jgi:hypothetical protein
MKVDSEAGRDTDQSLFLGKGQKVSACPLGLQLRHGRPALHDSDDLGYQDPEVRARHAVPAR